MATKKKLSTHHKMIDTETEDLVLPVAKEAPQSSKFTRRIKPLYFVAALLAVSALLLANKGLLVAAIVNSRPIFRWQLNSILINRYGRQTLEGMISEALISEEAKKAGIEITKTEIQAKQDEILKGLGGEVKLEDLLQYQGITKEDFDNQIKLQMTVQKILSKNLTITEDNINDYIATSGALLSATEPAALRAEAKQAIIEQKVSELLQPWFIDLKNKAKILRFIN